MRKSLTALLALALMLDLLVGCMSSTGSSSSSSPTSSAKAITAFSFATPLSEGAIAEALGTISVIVPFGTDVTSLIPIIVHTGSRISPASGVAQDFTMPVIYRVAAEDGSSQTYTVTVAVAPNTAKSITGFRFESIPSNGIVNELTSTISVTVPFGTNISALAPTIVHTGVEISPETGEILDFSGPVLYTVVAADSSIRDYTVTVTVAANTAKAITSFRFASFPADGIVNEAAHTVNVTVPFGTDLSSLTPTIIHTGSSISPSSGTTQNFTGTVFYTVTAANFSTQDYAVTVVEAPSNEKAITSFGFSNPAADGTITEATFEVEITVPSGTDPSALIPTISHTGVSISPASGSSQDFSDPVTYTVTAEDGTTQDYTVIVTVAEWANCGDVLTYAGENYPTVLIGDKCWFAKSLNIGTMVAGVSGQGTSCADIQKYCPDGSAPNCATFGGLYTWNQMMCGETAEEAQGICPAGWHVPSDPEFVEMINTFGDGSCYSYPSGTYPLYSSCGGEAGDQLKAPGLCQGRTPCGESGFNALLGGLSAGSGGSFYYAEMGIMGTFWTSSQAYNMTEAFRRSVALNQPQAEGSYEYSVKNQGRSVRCIKDPEIY